MVQPRWFILPQHMAGTPNRRRLTNPGTALPVLLAIFASACTPAPENQLQAVKQRGELVVLTRNSPTTYYEGPDGPTGFEYDLVRGLADRLRVGVRMKVVDRFADILPSLASGDADFAAAGITITPQREAQFRFTPSYQQIRQQVVHNALTRPPANIKDLAGRHLEVAAGTSYVERLTSLRNDYPKLQWTEVANMEAEELLLQVQEGLTELTIADSNIVALNRQYNPEMRIAFDLGEAEKLAWAFNRSDDDSLYQEAVRFIENIQKSGELAHLIERHYGPASRFNPFNLAVYIQKIESDLPRFKTVFEEAARRYQLDWRLLAAMSYQESYWNPGAVSPTGVRGIMMLTEITAQHLGVRDRLDPHQSILGGALYLRNLIDRLPERIPEPDRTWMALAAYNVGFNHLEDARVLAQRAGANPDRWSDVQQHLPLLAKSAWYTKVKHGYARGYEPVQFVTRIRTYFEILKKSDTDVRSRHGTDVLHLRAPAL